MDRFEILKGLPPKKSIIPDYYYGIDVGYCRPTVIAVCRVDSLGAVLFPRIESRTCETFDSVFDWYVELGGKYPIIAGRVDGGKDTRQLQGLIQKLDPNNVGHIKINRIPHSRLGARYAKACVDKLIILPECIISKPANWGLYSLDPATPPTHIALAVHLAFNVANKKEI